MTKDTSILISKLKEEDVVFLLKLLEYKERFEEENKQKISFEDFFRLIMSLGEEEDDNKEDLLD